ncbi:MAG TPA: aldehyde dehydrogenase family protein, partial [Demequina sp.]|nr:aldehyde dehydrogenase family protein [Demequina sp.]
MEVLAEVSDATSAEALQAVGAAHDAFSSWSQTAPRQRAELLRRAFEIMTDEIEDCARLIALENGKAWRDAMGEALYAAEFFRWFSEEASRIPGDFRYAPNRDKTIIVDHRPVGVAYMITPWNFPAAMATRKLAPALAAGCTAVLKPAGETPLTALWIADVLQRAGAPAGVVNVITTSEAGEVSSAVLADSRVATLSFTGSTPVGKLLLAQTAQRVLPSSMEMGGNAPCLVLEGSDVDRAVETAMVAKMRNGGSSCIAANRFYVHESLADDFSQRFQAALAALRIGPGVDQTNDLGAMVSVK